MVRTEDDTWDLASGVGVTATMVAAARAIASRADNPLISDPFAEPLVRAVGVDLLTRLAGGDLPLESLGDDGADGMRRMADNMAVRTRFFDEFFLDATASGITQAVILASGLDARAYRLAWPAGVTVFEIDQPEVIDFKSRTLADLGAAPAADLRTVSVDLRFDWPEKLREAGFDPGEPTAWSAEGLLSYLPPEAQDRLLDTVTALSAPGSRFATESAPVPDPADENRFNERMQQVSDRWKDHGFDLDFTELAYFGDRNEASAYLANQGWTVDGRTLRELFSEHHLPPLDEQDESGFADLRYVVSTLTDTAAP